MENAFHSFSSYTNGMHKYTALFSKVLTHIDHLEMLAVGTHNNL
jgi:hypothetical protein